MLDVLLARFWRRFRVQMCFSLEFGSAWSSDPGRKVVAFWRPDLSSGFEYPWNLCSMFGFSFRVRSTSFASATLHKLQWVACHRIVRVVHINKSCNQTTHPRPDLDSSGSRVLLNSTTDIFAAKKRGEKGSRSKPRKGPRKGPRRGQTAPNPNEQQSPP